MSLELELVEIAVSLDGRIPYEIKQKAREYYLRLRDKNISVEDVRQLITECEGYKR